MRSIVCFIFVIGSFAFGQTENNCDREVKAFCGMVRSGGSALVQCLKDHKKDIVDACQKRRKINSIPKPKRKTSGN